MSKFGIKELSLIMYTTAIVRDKFKLSYKCTHFSSTEKPNCNLKWRRGFQRRIEWVQKWVWFLCRRKAFKSSEILYLPPAWSNCQNGIPITPICSEIVRKNWQKECVSGLILTRENFMRPKSISCVPSWSGFSYFLIILKYLYLGSSVCMHPYTLHLCSHYIHYMHTLQLLTLWAWLGLNKNHVNKFVQRRQLRGVPFVVETCMPLPYHWDYVTMQKQE